MSSGVLDTIVKCLLVVLSLAILGSMLSVPISVFAKSMKLGMAISKICTIAIFIVAVMMFICLIVVLISL